MSGANEAGGAAQPSGAENATAQGAVEVEHSPGFAPIFGTLPKMTRRFAMMVLLAQAIIVVFAAFGARAIVAADGGGQSLAPLIYGSCLAVACVLVSGLVRTPIGVTLGWAAQVATFAMMVWIPAMVLVGLLFTGLWVAALYYGHQMTELTRRWHEENAAGA